MKTITDYEIEPDDYVEIEDILTERVSQFVEFIPNVISLTQ